jgi:hypothetical protein
VNLVEDLGVDFGPATEHPIVEPTRVLPQGMPGALVGSAMKPSKDIDMSNRTFCITPPRGTGHVASAEYT